MAPILPGSVCAVCTHPELEALPTREDTMLTWDADDLNR